MLSKFTIYFAHWLQFTSALREGKAYILNHQMYDVVLRTKLPDRIIGRNIRCKKSQPSINFGGKRNQIFWIFIKMTNKIYHAGYVLYILCLTNAMLT